MGCQTEVVVIAVELRLMPYPAYKLIHGLQFEIAFGYEIVDSYRRHVKESRGIHTVTVEKIVPGRQLQIPQDEVAALYVSAYIVVCFAYFLSFGKPYMHIVCFSAEIESVFKPSEL